ncbi:MAG: CoA transferase [Rhodobacteraceae bacterium]|nr:CoA transferase [Paracoccaceae bacterium]
MEPINEERTGPLTGIRVIDLSRILAGPLCTMNLGDMGAEIIKVEQPGRGDDTRSWGPPFAATEAAYFLGVNRNKRGMTLNLKDPRGQRLLKSLLRSADVLVENFKPGTLDGWGISREWIASEAPQLVHCEITGYGNSGPRSALPGYDFLMQAESGLMSITGDKDGEPAKLGVAIVDVCTGMYAAMGILAALNSRTRTGVGQKVETSLYSTAISMLINVASNYLISGKSPQRYGNGHPNIVPYRAFACADGSIALAVGNDAQFARLANCLGHPEWAEDSSFQRNEDRVRNREAIDARISASLRLHNVDQLLELFRAKGIPCSPINDVDAAIEDLQTRASNMVVNIEHPTAGPMRMLGIPYIFSETPASIDLPPPPLGADTDHVLGKLLGLDEDTVAAYRREGVV